MFLLQGLYPFNSLVWCILVLFQVQVKALEFAQLTEQSLIGNDDLSTWLHKELRKVQYMYFSVSI